MFLYKYLFPESKKVKPTEINEPEIINEQPEIINQQPEIINQPVVSSFITPLIMKPSIKIIKGSSFVNPNIFPELKKQSLTKNILKKLNTVYLVLNKNTGESLGIYDSLSKAKEYGQKITYHNCQILEFEINQTCRYLRNPVFEDNN